MILYSGARNASSWAMRAWLALREADVGFEERIVDIRRPQRQANLNGILEFAPSGTVPVLVDGDTVVFDSLAIMEYANDLAGGRLMPADPLERARARSFVAWQHAGLSRWCDRLSFESVFYADKRAMSFGERNEAAHVFGAWDAQLAVSGGPFLFGGLTLADLALVPSVLRLGRHAPTLATDWPRIHAWSDALLARPAVAEWMDEAGREPEVWYADYLHPTH